MQQKDIVNISVTDPLYPSGFMSLQQPISQFWIAGDGELLRDQVRVGIIGARRPSTYGREVAYELARVCASAGVTVVSGLALGIDSIAHKAAVEAGGTTIAVLPSSLDTIYPASHYGLANHIVQRGGLLLSEYYQSPLPYRHYFIQRNRLIAALSDVVVVVEATHGSGSRHTIRAATMLQKQVAAVPGNITNPLSEAPNQLIRDGAHPICTPSDLLSLLGVNEKVMKRQIHYENDAEKAIIVELEREHLTTDRLIERTGLDPGPLNAQLTILEIKGVVARNIANKWQIL